MRRIRRNFGHSICEGAGQSATCLRARRRVVGPFYLSHALGLGAGAAGAVMAVGPVTSALSGIPAGRLADRFGTRSVLSAGLFQMALGAFALALLPRLLGVWGYGLALVILTSGYQLFQAANNTGVMAGVAPGRRGVISGLLSLSRNLGLVTGASAMGALFTWAAGAVDLAAAPPGAAARGLTVSFALAGGMMLAALALARASGGRAARV